MCGIAGYFGQRIVDPAAAQRMMAALRQRGPTPSTCGSGRRTLAATDGPAPNALLHTRLSIIDPRPEADQPMENAAGDVWIAYNGEVYDWAADAADAEAAGYAFARTPTPSSSFTPTSTGGSASSRGCAECSRSRFSTCATVALRHPRPARTEAGRLRASRRRLRVRVDDARAAAVAAARGAHVLRRRASTRISRIGRFRRRARFSPTCRGCRRRTGCATTSRRAALETHEYWRPEPSSEPWLPTLDAAIRMRTVADRPLGLFLSSGIDS